MIQTKIDLNMKPLENLKKNFVKKVLRKVIREEEKIQKDVAKSNAQSVYRTGSLVRSLGVKVKTYRNSIVVGMMGPKSKYVVAVGTYTKGKKKGETKLAAPSKYLHFLEGGTKRAAPHPVLSKIPINQERIISSIADGISDLLKPI